jgi:hypothetical protein
MLDGKVTTCAKAAFVKAAGLTRQTGWLIVVPGLSASIFAAALTVLAKENKKEWPGP